MKLFFNLLIICLLTACALSFERPMPMADYGNPPQNYEETIKSYFKQVLKDPESARYLFGKPTKAYINNGIASDGKISWLGYMVGIQINAKNSFGGYDGFEPYMVFFTGNEIVKYMSGTEHPLVTRIEP